MSGLQLGPANAPLHLVEFADFECPFCAVAAGELRELRSKYPGTVSVTFRHLLIPGHTNSPEAALAAECAADQQSFDEYYDLLFENYTKLAKRNWRDLARRAHVPNLDQFDQCVASGRFSAHIDADTAAARAAGLGGTPSWIVGDSVYGGMLAMSQLEQWVQRARAPGRSSATRRN